MRTRNRKLDSTYRLLLVNKHLFVKNTFMKRLHSADMRDVSLTEKRRATMFPIQEKEVFGFVGCNMDRLGTYLIISEDNKLIIVDYDKQIGYLTNQEKIVRVISLSGEVVIGEEEPQCEVMILDKETGERYEGMVFNERPFGYGDYYNAEGLLRYRGMMIGWEKMGYGISYNDAGNVEYDGCWIHSSKHGPGKLYDNNSNLVYEGIWLAGKRVEDEYVGNGQDLHSCVRTLELRGECILKRINTRFLPKLEVLRIADESVPNAIEFLLENMEHLRTVDIGKSCFVKSSNDSTHSFRIANCPLLETIAIGPHSFCDYSDAFELKNLPKLHSLTIGTIGEESCNFISTSLVLESVFFGTIMFRSPQSTTCGLG